MNHKTIAILSGFAVVLVTAFLIVYLARPCDGSYDFNLKEGKFACEQAVVSTIIKGQEVKQVEESKSTKVSTNVNEEKPKQKDTEENINEFTFEVTGIECLDSMKSKDDVVLEFIQDDNDTPLRIESFVFSQGESKYPSIKLQVASNEIEESTSFIVRLRINEYYTVKDDLVLNLAKNDDGLLKVNISQNEQSKPLFGVIEASFKRFTSRHYKLKYRTKLI